LLPCRANALSATPSALRSAAVRRQEATLKTIWNAGIILKSFKDFYLTAKAII
jgi:hypothetical protein